MLSTIIFLVTLIILYIVNKGRRYPSSYPKGPWGLPFVGYLPFLGGHLCDEFRKISNKYGQVFSLKLGEYDAVVILDRKLSLEVQRREDMIELPRFPIYRTFGGGSEDGEIISFIVGDIHRWRDGREFYQAIMKRDKYSKSNIERVLSDKLEVLCNNLKPTMTSAEFNEHLYPMIYEVAFDLFVCPNFFSKEETKMYWRLSHRWDEMDQAVFLHCYFPSVVNFLKLFNIKPFKEYQTQFDKMVKMIKDRYLEIKRNPEMFEEDSCVREFLKKAEEVKGTEREKYYTDDVFIINTIAIIFGANASGPILIQWVLIYLSMYPDTIEKIQKEIEDTKKNGSWDFSHQIKFSNLEAFMMEVFRNQTASPALFRHPSTDTIIGDYAIPKDTLVILDVQNIQTMSDFFEDSEQFIPERFLDENNASIFLKHKQTFGIGKRRCLAERVGTVLVTTTLLRLIDTFDINVVEDKAKLRSNRDSMAYPGEKTYHFKRRMNA